MILVKNCRKQARGSTFRLLASSRMNCMTIVWCATCSMSAHFCEREQTHLVSCCPGQRLLPSPGAASAHLLHLQVNAPDDQVVGRFLAHQVDIVRQVLLAVIPAAEHTYRKASARC